MAAARLNPAPREMGRKVAVASAPVGSTATPAATAAPGAGNQARLRARTVEAPPPPRLPSHVRIGDRDDRLEHEADGAAGYLLAGQRPNTRNVGTLDVATGGLGVPGVGLPHAVRDEWEARTGVGLGGVRLHLDASAHALAQSLGARAFTIGGDIGFAAGAFAPLTAGGRGLIAHELAHVVQQARGGAIARVATGHAAAPVLQRAPVCDGTAPSPPAGAAPDDATVDAAIEWPLACDRNFFWWGPEQIDLAALNLLRGLTPEAQPRSWANRVLRAQRRIVAGGLRAVEGARLDPDGILGPRTYLALHTIAMDPANAARADLQGMGFDLDAIAADEHAVVRARALARLPQIIEQARFDVLGEAAVRHYDVFVSMLTVGDRDNLDTVLFGGPAPPGTRREDRIELLRRLYGSGSHRLAATASLVRVRRDFVVHSIDVREASRDATTSHLTPVFFSYAATTLHRLSGLDASFGLLGRLLAANRARAPEQRLAFAEALASIPERTPPPTGTAEIAAFTIAINLPQVADATRREVIATYLSEKAAREAAERATVDVHNRGVATQYADALLGVLDSDASRIERTVRYRTLVERHADTLLVELLIDELDARPGGQTARLFDDITDVAGGLPTLVEAALAGRHRDHPRVVAARATLIARHADVRRNSYVLDAAGGAVLLDGRFRVEVGRVAGDVNSLYLRDEDRERIRPDADARLQSALDAETRAYMARLISGTGPAQTSEEAGTAIVAAAFTAAAIDTDRDIEDVEWDQSLRVLGVRQAAPRADGVPRFEINYEVVERFTGMATGDLPWTAVPGTGGWRDEGEFELQLFWLAFSQTADVYLTAAKVIAVGAVLIVAWEVGVLAALASAAGGTVPALVAIGLSMGIYLLTHRRWTLEGLLLAGVEGYLAAVGFRIFSPVGAAVGRMVIPAALEQASFRRLVAAFLLRHATVGGLTGVTTGPAMVFIHDLVRVLQHGGAFSPAGAYLRAAGYGLMLGAVAEIGGSLVLASLFRAADSTVLARLSDVVAAIRARAPPISPAQWFAESAGALSQFRVYLRTILDEGLADAIYASARQRFEEASAALLRAPAAAAQAGRDAAAAWARGVRGTLQRQILDLAEIELSRASTNGLDRLLRLGRARLDDETLATMLLQVRRTPERVAPWLRYLGTLDDAAAEGMLARGQIRPLADAEGVLAASSRHPPTQLHAILTGRLDNDLLMLEMFSRRLNQLEATVGDTVMEALRTRGTAVTPRALLRAAEAGTAIDDDLLGGLRNMLDGTDAPRLETLLETMGADQVGVFLRTARTAIPDDLAAMRRVVATSDPVPAAWAIRLPDIRRTEALLHDLGPEARLGLIDIPALEADAMVGAIGRTRINAAFAALPTLRGTQVRALRSRLTDPGMTNWIDHALSESAGARRREFQRMLRVGEVLGRTPAVLPPASAMPATAVIVDTNAIIAIELLLRGRTQTGIAVTFKTLPPTRQDAINAIRRARGEPVPFVDPVGRLPTLDEIVGPNADLRATDIVAAETIAGEAIVGFRSPVLGDLRGLQVARQTPEYANVLAELQRAGVGEAKGAPDRSMVADALFADVDGVRPPLVSADAGVVVALAESFGTPPIVVPAGRTLPARLAALRPLIPGGTFTVTIGGRPMTVVFQ